MTLMQIARLSGFIALLFIQSACSNLGGAGASDPERSSAEKPSLTEVRNKAKVHVELGSAYLSGNLGTALDEARVAIAYDKTYAPGHLLMGQVYALLGQFAPAQMAFEEAARLAPGDPEVNNVYGWFLCSRNRQKEGMTLIEQAARNPYFATPGRAWTNLGLCNLLLKDEAAAEIAFVRADLADVDNMQAKYHIAAISYRNGNFIRARLFANALNQDSAKQTVETVWLALRIEHKMGNREGVQRYAQELGRRFPSSDENQAFLQGKLE